MDSVLKKELKSIEKKKLQARHAGDIAEEAKLCNNAGELLAEHRLFELAIEEHKMELQLSESVNDTMGIAISHRKVGECLCECADYEAALFHQQKYLDLSKSANNLVEEQRAYATIGRTWFQSAKSSADMKQAQSAFLESLSICDQLRETVKEKELLEMRARLYLNLGLVYENLNSKAKGKKYIEKALAIAVNQCLKDTEYRCHFSLGEIKMAEGRPAEALQCFERARKVAQHQKRKFDEADTLVQMGQVLLSLGDFKGGKNILKQCLKSMRHGNYVGELRASLIKAIKGTRLLENLQKSAGKDDTLLKLYEDLGDIFTQVKCYSQAIYYYHKQLDLSEKLKKSNQENAVVCVSLAASYADDKQYEKAKEYFYKELQLRDGDSNEQSETWCNIAQTRESAGDSYEDIRNAYMRGIECAIKAQKSVKQIRLLSMLADVQRKFSEEDDLKETLAEISGLEECKMEEDSETREDEEGSQGDDEDSEGEVLIEEEMALSDRDSESDEEEVHCSTGKAKRTKSKAINKRNEKGETVLHCAAIRGDYHLAKTSIEKGVSVHSRDYCGWQPLHEACNHGHTNIVGLLLDHGADISDPGGPHCRGMTPLHDATQNGHVDVVKLLVARGATLTLKNKDGQTALDQVLGAISSDMDDVDDSPDPELSQIRHELKTILTDAMLGQASKPRSHEPREMKRRDRLDFLQDSSDEDEPSEKISENGDISQQSPGNISRKRKNSVLDLDSADDDSDDLGNSGAWRPRNSQTKLARVSENFENVNGGNSLDQFSEELWGENSDDVNEELEANSDVTPLSNEVLSDISEDHPFSLGPGLAQDLDIGPVETMRQNDLMEPDSPPIPSKFGFSRSTKKQTKRRDDIPRTLISHPLASSRSDTSRTPTNRHALASSRHNTSKRGTKYLDPFTGSTSTGQELPGGSDAPALIPEREYLEGVAASDGWLIDDLPKKSGKRKRSSDIRSMLGPCELLGRHVPPAAAGSRSRPRSSSAKRTHLRQSRLGTHVVTGESSRDLDDDWDNDGVSISSPDLTPGSSTVTMPHTTVASPRVDAPASAPMRLRVKVKDKTFLIPCPSTDGEKKSVAWLAEQATFRYYSACGLKPVLVLSTAEGAVLSSDDYITDVLSNNEQVVGSIENWDLPPLVERYENACLSANTDVYEPILKILQADAYLSNVEFQDMALSPVRVLPLFRALQRHDQLVKLSLPGNRIGDIGFQHFISALPCLPNLTALVLSSNGISHKGFRHLASSITDDNRTSQIWTGITELDFSYNSLKDIAAGSLATILRSCSLLQTLNIQSCCFTQTTFQQRSLVIEAMSGLTRLRHLNVSYNAISADGLYPLLKAIFRSPLQSLDISYTTDKYDLAFGKALGEYLNMESCSVQELVCQGCNLRDADATLMVTSQCFLGNMMRLDLSLNDIGEQGCEELANAISSSDCPKQLNLSGNLNINNNNLLQFLKPPFINKVQRLNLSVCGLNSPLPEALENLETPPKRTLAFLNLSHNSINEVDLGKLSVWWKEIWGNKIRINLESPFAIFTINE